MEQTPTENTHINSREAQFLASQQARLEKLRSNNTQKSDGGDLPVEGNLQQQRKDFWILLKKVCFDLESQLSQLMGEVRDESTNVVDEDCSDAKQQSIEVKSKNNEKRPMYVTTQQRNEALQKLEHIQITIRCLGHYTMHSNKFTQEEARYLPDEIVNFAVPELPTADLRLLNIELQNLKGKSLQAQNVIIPKEKFRFKRYRKALQERKDVGKNVILFDDNDDDLVKKMDDLSSKDTVDEAKETAPAHHFDGITMSDKENCFLKVHQNGLFTEYNDAKELNATRGCDSESMSSDAKAFLIRDVDASHILVDGLYSSMHIINVRNTTIEITTPISGPVHVTNCINSKLNISFCRQLRIHDCDGVSFYMHVTSGPIIEGCKNMKFYQKDYISHGQDNYENEQNMYWDVKDFHWLKNLVKSPNFTVFSEEERRKELQQNGVERIVGVSSESEVHHDANDEVDDSSDEDEL